ncbi:MAG: LytR C-terminal domain-containing protein [Varibaculum cambriense]|uniref:LytR C-terminal domain-containing protein n=1 Tax=Varibaculum cambriense TaxID=184870 RepID=UPI00290953B6|nr:LytR C-terminal domain-containing protein [Varibaculum cambriense]MDU5316917.1 LytR C-terminal domain-containing protein [Varibaculum cambriense]MDU5614301.1 LytR C-terminal domain-containing protein [Varibaculum cambriense]MDU7407398.1 LytR C-terminal domain-containing protein [Varibaculum cambriense]
MSKQEFPPDEFDAMGEEGPSGAHRRPIRRWQTLLPILIVLVLGPALAWGGVALMKSTGKIDEVKSTATASATATTSDSVTIPSTQPTKINKPEDSTSPDGGNSSQSSVAAAEKANVRVRVLNASKRSGWAKQVAQDLQSAGFENPIATNSRARGLEGSTVLYRGEQYRAAAEEAAKVAGISRVEDANTGKYQIGDTDIAIYLIK